MENFLSCFRLAQCYVTINSVKQQWPYISPQLRTQSGESGNTLKNQMQWYGRRESKHLSVPTTKMEKRAATKVR